MTRPATRPIYLDNHATTPVDPRVLAKMLPYFTDVFGNASSTDHEHGAEAHAAVERARGQVARAIGAEAKEIVFTSGATESINLALVGAAEARKTTGRHIVTSVIEHPAVLDTCRHLESRGWEVTYVPVNSNGLHDPGQFAEAVRPDTILVTVMAANNEIGVLQPIREIAAVAHGVGAWFHTDATQAVAYTDMDVRAVRVDLLSFSAHKLYGPKGVGALFTRLDYPRVRLRRQTHGGDHERGIRSGTLNVPGIVGFGAAAELAAANRITESKRVNALRDSLLRQLVEQVSEVEINGDLNQRLPNNLNAAFVGLEARSLLTLVSSDVSLSLGSACATGKVEPSHVIGALGHADERSHASIRFGLGRFNTEEDIAVAVVAILNAVNRLRSLKF